MLDADQRARWAVPLGVPARPQSPGVLSATAGGGGSRSFCTSDIITNAEAATSIGVLAAAFLVMLSVARFHRTTMSDLRARGHRLETQRSEPHPGWKDRTRNGQLGYP